MIVDSVNGFLIRLNDKELFAKKLQFLIDNPWEIESMGKKSKEYITQFELNYICTEFESFIISD